jgi:hypothetical protein
MNKSEEIPLTDAILSWYNTVYLPVINIIDSLHIMRAFRKRTKSDMYVWIIKYWDELKQKFGEDYPLDETASAFKHHFATSAPRMFLNKIANLILKKQIKKSIKT